MTTLLRMLPHGHGQLRIAGYYLHGRDEIVVYDVLDDKENHVSDLRVVYPAGCPFLPPGTRYPIG